MHIPVIISGEITLNVKVHKKRKKCKCQTEKFFWVTFIFNNKQIKFRTIMSQQVVNLKDNQEFSFDVDPSVVDAKGNTAGTIKKGGLKVEVVTPEVLTWDEENKKFVAGASLGSTQVNVTATITPDDADEEEYELTDFFTAVNESGKAAGFKFNLGQPTDQA